MRKTSAKLLLAAAMMAAIPATIPAIAQVGAPPGAADVSRIKAGNYTVDPNHSQVAWTVSHYAITLYHGLFGSPTGTLTLDPAKPGSAAVSIEIPIDKLITTSTGLDAHLKRADMLDSTQFPTATFKSTNVAVSGTKAKITGDLTLHGVTKPVVLDAQFMGAGVNPLNKKDTVGFVATTTINRTDFGIKYGIPNVGEQVDLRITVAFEYVPAA